MDKIELLSRIGGRIRAVRTEANLTQAQVAERAVISNEFLSKIERGRAAPSVVTLYRIADALGVRVVELVDFEIETPSGLGGISADLVQAYLDESGPEGERLLVDLARMIDGILHRRSQP